MWFLALLFFKWLSNWCVTFSFKAYNCQILAITKEEQRVKPKSWELTISASPTFWNSTLYFVEKVKHSGSFPTFWYKKRHESATLVGSMAHNQTINFFFITCLHFLLSLVHVRIQNKYITALACDKIHYKSRNQEKVYWSWIDTGKYLDMLLPHHESLMHPLLGTGSDAWNFVD